MARNTAITYLLVLALVVGAAAGLAFLPKKYKLSEDLLQTVVFWNDQEAFFFLSTNSMGRSANLVQERLESWSYYPYLSLLFADLGFYNIGRAAYHLRAPDRLERVALPESSSPFGIWTLHEGRLQSNPPRFNPAGGAATGFRWNGSAFVEVEPPSARIPTGTQSVEEAGAADLTADDLTPQDEEDTSPSVVAKPEREAFKKAGWHYKMIGVWDARGKEANLPITLGQSSFRLTLLAFPQPTEASRLDPSSFGAKSVAVSGDSLTPRSQVLWAHNGWREVSKDEYQALAEKQAIRAPQSSSTRLWLVALVAILLLRVGKPVLALLGVVTLKGRMLKNLATTYSFPPVTTAQFPRLDQKELERYTLELEGLGFARLLDLSLVSDAPSQPGNFCRLLAHPRQRCFAEINQLFPNGMAPLSMKCALLSYLQDGWSVTFTDRKPMALSSLFRRAKAIGGCLPATTTAGLLEAMLKLREQVCSDLAISALGDATLEVYMAEMQRSLQDMRAALEGRNLAAGLSLAGLRKVALLKSKPEYTWLGDYPQEARRRQFGAPLEPRSR